MKLITKQIKKDLLANFNNTNKDGLKPPLKLFCPWGGATWLISEMYDNEDTLFGLADLGHGSPELGYVSLSELASIRGPLGLKIERDIYFEPDRSLVQYADDARLEQMVSKSKYRVAGAI